MNHPRYCETRIEMDFWHRQNFGNLPCDSADLCDADMYEHCIEMYYICKHPDVDIIEDS